MDPTTRVPMSAQTPSTGSPQQPANTASAGGSGSGQPDPQPVSRPTAGAEGSPRVSFGPEPSGTLGQSTRAVADDISALVRAEVALAKAELMVGVKAKAIGAGLLVAVALLGWLAVQGLLLALGFGIAALGLPGWAAALIVTALLLAVAAAAGLVARRKLAVPVSVETSKHNVEEDVTWAKRHLSPQEQPAGPQETGSPTR